MLELADPFLHFDHEAMEFTAQLRWAPATALFTLASFWWVKGPLLVGLGSLGDLRPRRLLPGAALCATAAFFLASAANGLLKGIFERSRPPLADSSIEPLVALPGSPSFPSGHAMTAFAAATAIAVLRPRLRWPALGVAALVAISRPYLGVHFWLDVGVGAALGAAIGLSVALAARAVIRRRAVAVRG